jgi:hypothetical protein
MESLVVRENIRKLENEIIELSYLGVPKSEARSH